MSIYAPERLLMQETEEANFYEKITEPVKFFRDEEGHLLSSEDEILQSFLSNQSNVAFNWENYAFEFPDSNAPEMMHYGGIVGLTLYFNHILPNNRHHFFWDQMRRSGLGSVRESNVAKYQFGRLNSPTGNIEPKEEFRHLRGKTGERMISTLLNLSINTYQDKEYSDFENLFMKSLKKNQFEKMKIYSAGWHHDINNFLYYSKVSLGFFI